MKLLQELHTLQEGKKHVSEGKKKSPVSKDVAAKVYHRDYLRTKNKKYRKYDTTNKE